MTDILVVEDNPVNRRLVETILLQAGFAVELAEHGEQALSMLADGDYRIVLMDLNMPVMDGYQAIAVIRQNPRWAGLPVVAVTVDTSEGIMQRVRDAGFSDYLGKPYTREDLVESVRFHLGEDMDADY